MLLDLRYGSPPLSFHGIGLLACHATEFNCELQFIFILPVPMPIGIDHQVELVIPVIKAKACARELTLHIDGPSLKDALG